MCRTKDRWVIREKTIEGLSKKYVALVDDHDLEEAALILNLIEILNGDI